MEPKIVAVHDEPVLYYRMVEVHDDGVRTLFHGTNKTRLLEPDTWLKSEQKLVRDGSSGTQYISGWHVLTTNNGTEEFKKRYFRKRLDKLKIIPVWVKGKVWKKEHSRSEVYLTEWMKIDSETLEE